MLNTKGLILTAFILIPIIIAGCTSPEIPDPQPLPTRVSFQVELTQPAVPAAASVVDVGEVVPPEVVPPCKPEECLFSGQTVTVIVAKQGGEIGPIVGPLHEVRSEFQAAT